MTRRYFQVGIIILLAAIFCVGGNTSVMALSQHEDVIWLNDNYYGISDFSNGVAVVTSSDGHAGCINTAGNVVVPIEYDLIMNPSSNTPLFGRQSASGITEAGVLDDMGNLVFFSGYNLMEFSEGLFLFQGGQDVGYKYGFLNADGDVAIRPEYEYAGAFHEGLAIACVSVSNGQYGYIDKSGNVVIQFEYDYAYDFSEGVAWVWKNGKGGLIDKTGQLLLPFEYDNAYDFSNGLAAVRKNGVNGYINKSGQMLLPVQFDWAYSFKEGYAIYLKDNFTYMIDTECSEAPTMAYDDFRAYSGGLAAVKQNDKWGYIDTEGRAVTSFEYDYAGLFSSGVAIVKKDNRWGILSKPNVSFTSGTCGDDLTWSLSSSGVLTICGFGGMLDYTVTQPAPWNSYRSEISAVIVNNGVTSIGNSAFRDCRNLVSVSLPESIWKIGYAAFNSCYNLTEIQLPTNVVIISGSAFAGCTSLKNISMSEYLSEIGNAAFRGCSSLESIEIPDNVYSMSSQVFEDCSSLESVILPASLTDIGQRTFYGCAALKSITIPADVTDIGTLAFSGCGNLIEIRFLGSLPSIAEDAFQNVAATVYIPDGDSSWSPSVCVNYGGSLTWNRDTGSLVGTVVASGVCGDDLSWKLENNGVLTISGSGDMWNYDYGGNTQLTEYWEEIKSIVVRDGVTSIGDCAFSSQSVAFVNLVSITLPSSLEQIGYSAFFACTSTNSINIPDGVTTIGDAAFQGCHSLQSVVIPKSVTSIGRNAFQTRGSILSISVDPQNPVYDSRNNCNAIIETDTNTLLFGCASTVIPNSVEKINCEAFNGNEQLTHIVIPESVITISDGYGAWSCFRGCIGLKTAGPVGGNYNLEFSWTETIPHFAFSGMSALQSVVLPHSITGIEEGAFTGCAALCSITIPDNCTYIGTEAFSRCRTLTEITFPETAGGWFGGRYIRDRVFDRCDSLIKVTIPEGWSIGEDAFGGWNGLKTAGPIGGGFNLEYGWSTAIPSGAFSNCSELRKVVIPETIEYCDGVFANSPKLTTAGPIGGGFSIEFGWADMIPDNAFANCHSLVSIMIPRSIREIEHEAFKNCENLSRVHYGGTIQSWYALTDRIGYRNEYLLRATIYCSDGTITDSMRIDVSAGSAEMFLGERLQLTAKAAPGTVTWSSADSSIASVNSRGVVTANDIGYVRITAECGSYSASIQIMVSQGTYDTFRIRFGKSIYIRDLLQNRALTWRIENSNIAKLDSYYTLTGLKVGRTRLLGVTSSGKIAVIPVEVYNETEDMFMHDANIFDNDLALWGAYLSLDSYKNTGTDLYLTLDNLNFSKINRIAPGGTNNPARTFAYKKLSNGKTLVVVIVRGSSNLNDWLTNFDSIAHGFESASNSIYNDLKSYVNSLELADPANELVLFVTGHSQGGAVAGLIAQKVANSSDRELQIPQNRVFVYTYASANYDADRSRTYSNVHNIVNTGDIVPNLPPNKSKVGRVYEFYNGHKNLLNPIDQIIANHSMDTYISALVWEKANAGATNSWVVQTFHCPVDVAVYNIAGELIAYTRGSNVFYLKETTALLLVSGDEKYLYTMSDEDYTVRLTGTGDGEMTCTAQLLGVEDGKATVYENVQLTEGKQMVSVAEKSGNTIVSNLFNVGESTIREIDSQGNETPHTHDYKLSVIRGTVSGITTVTYAYRCSCGDVQSGSDTFDVRFDRTNNQLAVDALPTAHSVYAACYDDMGRFKNVFIIPSNGNAICPDSTNSIQLMILHNGTFVPYCQKVGIYK